MLPAQRPRPKGRNYDDAVINLLRMIDIAVESCDYITNCYDGYQDVRRGELNGLRQRILHASPEMRNLRSLNVVRRKLMEDYDVLSMEPEIKFFWAKVEDECIMQRRDYVARVLKRGRVIDYDECDCLEELCMEQVKDGRITEVQMRKVQRMIQAFSP